MEAPPWDSDGRILAQLADLGTLLGPLKACRVRPGFSGADIFQLVPLGVPALGLRMDPFTYFDYHHSEADTLDKVNPELLRANAAVMAVMAYAIAETPGALGR